VAIGSERTTLSDEKKIIMRIYTSKSLFLGRFFGLEDEKKVFDANQTNRVGSF
jgi:hypothetical protein